MLRATERPAAVPCSKKPRPWVDSCAVAAVSPTNPTSLHARACIGRKVALLTDPPCRTRPQDAVCTVCIANTVASFQQSAWLPRLIAFAGQLFGRRLPMERLLNRDILASCQAAVAGRLHCRTAAYARRPRCRPLAVTRMAGLQDAAFIVRIGAPYSSHWPVHCACARSYAEQGPGLRPAGGCPAAAHTARIAGEPAQLPERARAPVAGG